MVGAKCWLPGTNGALGTALPAQAWPFVVLGSGGEAQLMRWARSLQVVTCSGRNGGMWAPDDGIWRRVSVVGEAGEVCARASGAAAGPKVQPADVLGLAHSHVDQAQGAELLCACAGVARRSTAAGAGAAAGGGSEPMWVPCLRVWAA